MHNYIIVLKTGYGGTRNVCVRAAEPALAMAQFDRESVVTVMEPTATGVIYHGKPRVMLSADFNRVYDKICATKSFGHSMTSVSQDRGYWYATAQNPVNSFNDQEQWHKERDGSWRHGDSIGC